MEPFRYFEAELNDGVATVRFRLPRMHENEVVDACNEIIKFAKDRKCPRVIIDFVPKAPECLYSVFLAKLVSMQRQLQELGGGLRICNCNDDVRGIFTACCLEQMFDIRSDNADPEKGWDN